MILQKILSEGKRKKRKSDSYCRKSRVMSGVWTGIRVGDGAMENLVAPARGQVWGRG